MTSNSIHEATISKSKYTIALEIAELSLLPDLATQIQSYIALPLPTQRPTETIFVLSFGFWDVYDFSRLDYPIGQNATDNSIKEIFKQLDILYNHFTTNLYSANTTDHRETTAPSFRVIIPRLFDPTLLPGWLTLRPSPPSPSSVAEQQKNAVYLTERWNNIMVNQVAQWVVTPPPPAPQKFEQSPSDEDIRNNSEPFQPTEEDRIIQKDVFYYDLPKLLLDIIIEHQLEDEGLSDASGLGKGESLFESVYQPCVHEAEGDDTDGLIDLNGMLVCKRPEDYLFWDSFNLGPAVKGMIGKEIGDMVRGNKTLRNQWEH
jgi:hypothetical protein